MARILFHYLLYKDILLSFHLQLFLFIFGNDQGIELLYILASCFEIFVVSFVTVFSCNKQFLITLHYIAFMSFDNQINLLLLCLM